MSTPTIKATFRKLIALFAAIAALSILWSCREAEEDPDQYLNLTLNASYADYDTVSIRLMDAGDTAKLLETVWNAKIPEPAKFPKHKLKEARGKDFIVQIRCYNAKRELLLAKDVKVEGKRANPSVVLVPELRLLGIKPSKGDLVPPFASGTFAYSMQVAEDVESLTLTASPIDAGNLLSVDGLSANWGAGIAKDLAAGPNVVILTVSTKDGKKSRSYEVTINRGRVIPPEEVTGVTLPDTALTLYTGEGPTPLKAKTNPPGALLEWSSSEPNVAAVDGAGRVTHVGPGLAKVTVKAGNHSASVAITVKKDLPVVSVGDNLAVKPGTEVVFNVVITQDHGKLVSFKYDLDGDTAWDNTDTTNVAGSQTLKHTYAGVGTFTARFESKDGEGNVGAATRTITVDNSLYQLAIVSPKGDTLINTRSILVRYTVNGTLLEKAFSDLPEGTSPVTIDTGTGADKRTATRQITVDTKAPGIPVFTGSATSASLKPTWTWKSGGEGDGRFRSSLDSAGLALAIAGTSSIFTPPENLIPGDHILWVQERDEAGNWSLPGKFKITIKAEDTTPPNAPKVTGTTPTPTAPKWSWSTGGAGGMGTYKFKVADSTLKDAAETRDTVHTLAETPAAGKSYTLYVAERDSAGNWSKAAGFAIVFDPDKPGVVILAPKPSGTLYTTSSSLPFNGTAGGARPIAKVSYRINGIAAADAAFDKPAWSIPSVPFSEGSPTLVTIVATDSMGITGEASLTVLLDNTKPGLPNITTTPPTPTKSIAGSWAWTAGTDSPTGSGVNGNYRYSLDGSTWSETRALIASDLALKPGLNAFQLQEQDFAGNWSLSATRNVVSDPTGPLLAVTNPIPGSTSNSIHIVAKGTVSDSLTSVASVIVTGQLSGAGTATLTGADWVTGDLVLNNSGADTLTFTATDAVGNTTVKTVIFNINVALPGIEIAYPTEGMLYNKDTITVRYSVNGGSELTKHFPALATEGNIGLEVVSPPNEAGQTNKKTVTIFRDKTAPGAPTVSPAGRTWTKVDPAWTFTSGGDNPNGSGTANTWSYQITGAVTTSGTVTSPAFTIPNAAEGTYNFQVRQQDKAGNWSAYSAVSTLVFDKTAPVVTVSYPPDQMVTSTDSVLLTCGPGATGGGIKKLTAWTNSLYCTATDSAGNVGTKGVGVIYLPNTLFVKKSGTGKGTSWQDAAGNLETVLKGAKSGTNVWVGGGVYVAADKDSGFIVGPGVNVYGGFPPATLIAKSVTERVFAKDDTTYLMNPSNQGNVVSMVPRFSTALKNASLNGAQVVLNGAQVGVDVYMGNTITIRKVKFFADSDPTKAGIRAVDSDLLLVDSCIFTGFSVGWFGALTRGQYGTITVSNTLSSGNVWPSGGGMNMYEVQKAIFNNVWFMDSYKAASGFFHLGYGPSGGEVNMKDCVFKAQNQADAISIGSATKVITTTTFSPTPPAPPNF